MENTWYWDILYSAIKTKTKTELCKHLFHLTYWNIVLGLLVSLNWYCTATQNICVPQTYFPPLYISVTVIPFNFLFHGHTDEDWYNYRHKLPTLFRDNTYFRVGPTGLESCNRHFFFTLKITCAHVNIVTATTNALLVAIISDAQDAQNVELSNMDVLLSRLCAKKCSKIF